MPDSLDAILKASSGPVAIFTDFDGTLVDIAPTPDAVRVPDGLHDRLQDLFAALGGALAVISGRTISDIDEFLPDQPFSISGSHGAEQRHQNSAQPADPGVISQAGSIATELESALGDEAGVMIEPKPTGVAVHYRAAPEKQAIVRAAIDDAIADRDGFDAIDGKKVIEIRPAGTDKGSALEALMRLEPFAGRTPVFIGDDVTDEDGFRAAQALGGFGIKVGPGTTAAHYNLADISAVHAYFDALIATTQSASKSSTTAGEGIVK